MHETWSFDYEGRIFATPVITLPIVDKAIEELQWCIERGAKTVLIRPAPVPGYNGSRSFGFEEFDPFWQACVDAGIPVSMHASDSGYSEVLNIWEPASEFKPFAPTTGFRTAAMGSRAIEDAMTRERPVEQLGHGLRLGRRLDLDLGDAAHEVAEHAREDDADGGGRHTESLGCQAIWAARTTSTSGSWVAMRWKVSPSSAEAKTSPLRVPR
jgi:hypothetical protein